MALEVGAITGKFTLKDEFSKPMVAIYDATNKTLNKIAEIPVKANESVAKIVSTANKATNTMNGLQSRLDKLNERLGRTAIGSKNFELLSNEINKTQKELDKASSAIKKTDGALSALKTTLGSIGILALGKSIFDTTAKFEKYNAVLKNSLGTQAAATQAFQMIQKYASTTPFSVDELTASYIKFVNRGLKPTQEELVKLGDIAASQGKSFDQLTEAVLDATSGEFERLKEFGIRASSDGDRVTLAFKGMNMEVAKTPEAIQAAILSFGDLQGVAGSTAAISQTLTGQWSNLLDNATNLASTVGDMLAPAFKATLTLLNSLVSVTIQFIRDNKELLSIILATAAAYVTVNKSISLTKDLITSLPGLIAKIGSATTIALGPASLAIAAIAAMTSAYVILRQRIIDAENARRGQLEAINKLPELTQKIDKQTEALLKQIRAQSTVTAQSRLTNEQARTYQTNLELLVKKLKKYGITREQITKGEEIADSARLDRILKLNEELKKQNKIVEQGGESSKDAAEKTSRAASGATNALGSFVEKAINGLEDIMKSFNDSFEGLSEEVKTFIIQIANALGELGAAGINNFFQRMQNQIQSAQRKVQEFALLSQVYSAKFREQIEKETKEFEAAQDAQLQAFIDKENERLSLEQQAANERIKIITDEYLARKSLQDEEFARRQQQVKAQFEAEKNARRLEYEQKLQYLKQESADKEQAQIAEELMRQDWANYEADLQARLNDALIAIAQEKSGKDQELNQKENEAIEAQEKADADKITKLEEEKNKRIADAEMEKEKRVQDFRDKQKQREKDEAKKLALVKYNLDVAALEVQKQAARATAALTLAQSVASSVLAGISIAAAIAPFNPFAAVAIGATTTAGLMAIAASTYSLQMASISSQFVLPPAELFLNSGGRIVPGAGNSDTVPARLTPGEMVVDRSTTEGLRDMVRNGNVDKNATININFMAGSIQNNGAMDERAMDELSYAITRRLEREYSRS